jgi:8-oxo-dGTP pyrophosphatase MutT (NUDIX family)
MTNLFSVTGLLVKDGLVLAVSRKNNPKDFGLPGGKIDPGETSEQALIREVKEETGLDVVAYEGVFEDKDRVENGELRPCKTYRVLSWKGELRTKETGVVCWVKPSVITDPTTSFHEYNSKLFAHLSMSVGLKLG